MRFSSILNRTMLIVSSLLAAACCHQVSTSAPKPVTRPTTSESLADPFGLESSALAAREYPANSSGLELHLFLATDPPDSGVKSRLTLSVKNISDHLISFPVWDREVPCAMRLKIDEFPNIKFTCISNGEPPREDVILEPGESREFHPLSKGEFVFMEAPSAPHLLSQGQIWHIRAIWPSPMDVPLFGPQTTDAVAMTLD